MEEKKNIKDMLIENFVINMKNKMRSKSKRRTFKKKTFRKR